MFQPQAKLFSHPLLHFWQLLDVARCKYSSKYFTINPIQKISDEGRQIKFRKNDGNENVFFTTLHQYSMKDKKMELFFSLTTSI